MGNQPSKDGLIDNTNQRRIRPSISSAKTIPTGNLNKQDYQQLENSRIMPSKTSRLLPKKQQTKKQQQQQQQPVIVSPIRHQLVLTDHVTPLVSLSAASSFNVYQQQRRSSSTTYRDTRSMSSTSITSEEGEPNTPTHMRSSYDEFAHSFMNDIHSQHQQQKKLSTSLPVKYSDGFIINTTTSTPSVSFRSLDQISRKRESKEVWVYEYGAEKERDR